MISFEADVEWVVDPEYEIKRIGKAFLNKFERDALELVSKYAPQIRLWMFVNAPWRNRTGMARALLFAEVFYKLNEYVGIFIGHGVDLPEFRSLPIHHELEKRGGYGKYLEWRSEGKNKIIRPALEYWANILNREIALLLLEEE